MRAQTAILLIALVAFIGVSARESTPEVEEKIELGGWLVSGKSVNFSAADPSRRTAPPGKLVTFRPAMRINDLLVHSDTLWIGTEGGLFAYDLSGDSLAAVEGPVAGSIQAVTIDDDGAFWVGGRNGLSVRSRSGWKHYTSWTSRFFSMVTAVVVAEERTWIATDGNGCGFVGDGMLRIYTLADSLLDDRVECVVEGGEGTIWFGTASGLCRSDSLQWKSMRYGHRLPIGPINDMLMDEEGSLFLAIEGQGVAIYSLGRVRFFDLGRGLPSGGVNAFSLDPLGKVWAAGSTGLSLFEGSGWVPYRLPGVPIGRYTFLSIHHDADGETYLGTDEGVVIILSRETTREIELPRQHPSGAVSPLRSFGDDVWFSDGDAVYRYGKGVKRIDPPDASFEGSLTDVAIESDQDYWMTSRFGVLHFNGESWEIFDRRQGLPTEYFTRVVRDGKGILWFGTYDSGILGFTGRNWIHHSIETGLPDDRIDDMVLDRAGDLWVISATGKVNRLHEGNFEELALPSERSVPSTAASDSLERKEPFIRYLPSGEGAVDDGSTDDWIAAGLDGPGNFLVANTRGIFRFMGSDWQVISLPEGFGAIRPTAVMGSARGRIWLGTEDKGVFVRSRSGWSRLGSMDGLLDEDIRSLTQDSSGNIWIGTRAGGIAVFTPSP